MALELIHTSAPSGLHPGTSGFCTVAMTTGMSAAMEERLAALSGYRPADGAGASPPSCSHLRMEIGGRVRSVVSVVREASADHSGRRNKLAHHLVLEDSELADAGPASLLRAPGIFVDRFEGPARWIPNPRALPAGAAAAPRRCDAWERACGDAGWAGELVNQWHLDPSRVSCVVYPSSGDPLALIDEALSLLPPSHRWRVAFATHFQQPVAGAPCAWRFCLAGTQAALEAPGRATGFFIDLEQAKQDRSKAGLGRYAELARRGGAPWWAESAVDAAHASAPASAPESMALPWRDSTGAIPRVDAAPMDAGRRGAGMIGDDDASLRRSSEAAASVHSSAMPWILALVTLIGGAAVGVAVDRVLLARSGAGAAGDDAVVETEIDRLQASRRELESQLRRSEESLATTRQGLRRTEEERDHALSARDSAVAQLRSFEKLAEQGKSGASSTETGSGDAAKPRERRAFEGSASPGGSPIGARDPTTPAPPSPNDPARGVAPAPTPPAGDASPGDPSGPPSGDEPVDSKDRVIVLPANAWDREISSLGVVSTDRRRLIKLARIIRTLDLLEAPREPWISVKRGANGRSLRISSQPREGPPREVLLIEAEGAEIFVQWLLTGPPSRLAPYFEPVDAMLATSALVVRLDVGTMRELVTAPRRFEVRLDAKGEGVVNLGWRIPTVRLAADVLEGWTLGAGATETSLRLEHASGALRVDLDRAAGTVQLRFASPLVDAILAAEKERRDLEADRSNVAPDERPFHDAREREVRETLDRLKAQQAAEKLQVPKDFPQIRVMTADESRALAIIGPRPRTQPGDAR